MSDAVMTAVIAAIGSAVATLCGVVVVWLNLRAAQAALALKMEESRKNQEEMKQEQKQMHSAVNSQMDAFKKVLAEAKFAEGDLAGRAALTSEQRDKALAAMESQKKIANGGSPPAKVEIVNPDPVPVVVEKMK